MQPTGPSLRGGTLHTMPAADEYPLNTRGRGRSINAIDSHYRKDREDLLAFVAREGDCSVLVPADAGNFSTEFQINQRLHHG